MFFVSAFLVIALVVYLASTSGPRVALWVGWFVAMTMLPVWLVMPVGSLILDLRVVAAVTILACFVLFPTDKITFRPLLLDVLMFALVGSIIASAYFAGEVRPLTIPELLKRWVPAYLMGRLYIQSLDDLGRVLPVMAVLLIVLACYAAFESFTRINPINQLLGKYYAVLEAGEGYRWGIKRAQGPLDHPIFFGMMTTLLFPWALEIGWRAKTGEGPRWWYVVPIASFGSVFCTASRGPVIAALGTAYVTVFFRFPKLRIPMFVFAVVAVLGVVYGKDALVEALSKAAGEKEEDVRIVYINGEEVEYTGTKHRLLLFTAYEEAIQQTGWLGYGIRLKNIPIEEHLVERFSSIDNHYLLSLLQHGWMGVGLFVAVTMCILGYLLPIAWKMTLPQSGLAAAMFGSILMVTALLQTVWFAPDYGYCWLFMAGVTGGIRGLPRTPAAAKTGRTPTPTVSVENPLAPRLVPGCAPISGNSISGNSISGNSISGNSIRVDSEDMQ